MLKIISVILLLTLFAGLNASARDKELGIVNYFSKYELDDPKKEETSAKELKIFFSEIEKLETVKPEWVDVDIFLPHNRVQADNFKRIIIPRSANWFTMEMYEGMLQYVKSGGLLITQSALLLLDKNADYKGGDPDTTMFARKSFMGVSSSGSSQMREMKVLQENALTKGFAMNEWVKFNDTLYGRISKNQSAQEVIIAKQKWKDGEGEGTFLAYKSTGQGACIYLDGSFIPKEPVIVRLMKNILSEETLKWLCVRR